MIDKNTEEACPGYYKADLVDFDIKTEVTSTTRCGFFRFIFPETDEGHVYFNLMFPQEYESKVKGPEGLDPAQENKSESPQDTSQYKKTPGAVSVRCKTNKRGSDAALYASEGSGK